MYGTQLSTPQLRHIDLVELGSQLFPYRDPFDDTNVYSEYRNQTNSVIKIKSDNV